MEEQWAEIKDFEDYQISTLGRVKSFKQDKINGKIMAFGSSGVYKTVVLRKNNKPYNKYIHRLVAEAFIPNPNNLPEVNHKDENVLNNNVSNLEWISSIDNIKYGTRIERSLKTRKYKDVPRQRPVRCIETGEEFPSMSAAARAMGVRDTTIRKVCIGKAQTCKNLHWEFIE